MEREGFRVQHMGLRDDEGVPNSFESIHRNYHGAQEMDTLLLRDGTIAVLNERRLKLSPEQVESMNLPELEQLMAEQGGEVQTIPLLPEFLGLASDSNTQLRIELRGSSPEQVTKLGRQAVEQLATMQQAGGFRNNPEYVEKRLRFVTFSIPALQEIQSTATTKGIPVSTGLFWPSAEVWTQATSLYDETKVAQVPDIEELEWNERGIVVAAHYGFQEIELQPQVITERHVQKAHQLGLELGASLVKDEATAERLAKLGVDHILTEK